MLCNNTVYVSQQPYIPQRNSLYRSVQLKMVSLLIWIVYCFEHIAKFDENAYNKGISMDLGNFQQY